MALHSNGQLLASYDLLTDRSSSSMLTTLMKNAVEHAGYALADLWDCVQVDIKALQDLTAYAEPQARAALRQVQLLGAEIELAAGQAQAAQRLVPPGVGRPELLLRTQALLQTGGAAAMTGPLQTWVALHPRDAGAWHLLASVWQGQGQTLRAVRAEAEAHAARYDYAAAVDRFKAGQALARHSTAAGDFVEASIIDTRLRAVELLLREQAAER